MFPDSQILILDTQNLPCLLGQSDLKLSLCTGQGKTHGLAMICK